MINSNVYNLYKNINMLFWLIFNKKYFINIYIMSYPHFINIMWIYLCKVDKKLREAQLSDYEMLCILANSKKGEIFYNK